MSEVRHRYWAGLAAVTLLAYGGLVLVDRSYGTLRGAATGPVIALYLVAFGTYLALIYLGEQSGGWSPAWAWGAAVLARLLLLLTTPSLSDDIYRYLWDGHLALSGVSPYALPVNDAALDFLAVPARALVNNDWMASPYLPAAQALFAGAGLLGQQPLVLQAVLVLVDLAAALLIARLLALAALPGRRLLIYLLNPLVIVEVAHGAHIDAWMVFLSLLAVRATLVVPARGPRGLLAPLWLALATLTKPLPALLSPVLFWRWTWPQRLFYPVLMLLLLLPFGQHAGWGVGTALDGRGLFGALLIYASRWKFNSGLFALLERLLGGESLAATSAAKAIVALLLLAALLATFLLAHRYRGARAMLRLCALPLMAYILFTPTFHPWYLLLLLAFLPFLPPQEGEPRLAWAAIAPWLWLSATAVFSYLAYTQPDLVVERPWVRALQWLPTWGLVIAGLTRGLRQNGPLHAAWPYRKGE